MTMSEAERAARIEAERRWPQPDARFLSTYAGTWRLGEIETAAMCAANREGFQAGAAWQREQMRALHIVRATSGHDGAITFRLRDVNAALGIEVSR
jgi:hypothetical protein